MTSWIADRLLELRDCVGQELARTTSGPPCSLLAAPGAQADLSECSSCASCGGGCLDGGCGVAWVRLASAYQSEAFPVPVQTVGCSSALAYVLEVGVSRCIPVHEEEPLSQAEAIEATLGGVEDMLALRKAIRCCFSDSQVLLGAWTPSGPQGGCVGGSWSVTVGT